ncbi:MAG: ATP-binding protein [Elusimicrobia bacterium]|nr:ATP-binding protein [Elusimicrobiota bacterium]
MSKNNPAKIKYVRRLLQDLLLKYLSKPEILAIVGPRQSGKTTLLKQIFKSLKNAVYIDFEDRDILKIFNNDIKTFYNLYCKQAKYLFIDEFQYAREGGKSLKYLYDTHKIKIIISGSSALDLTHQALKYLVGRIFVFTLFPFSFAEYLSYVNPALYEIYSKFKNQIERLYEGTKKKPPSISRELIDKIYEYYQDYVIFGGYPRVVLSKDKEEKLTVLKNIYNTYFLREIRDILQLGSEDALYKLIKAVALQIGSSVNYNELCQITGLNYNNLLKHLNILEKTFVIKKLTPFCKNKRTEILKTPKIYFLDNGFRNLVVNNFQRIDERVDRGVLNENFIAGQIVAKENNLHYWRTKAGAEVDFVIEKDAKIIAIEVKSTLISNKFSRAILSFREKYSPYRTIMISEKYLSFDRENNILFLPAFFI